MRLGIGVPFQMAAIETTLQGGRLLQPTGRSKALRRKLDWNSNGMYTAWLQGSSRTRVIKILQGERRVD
jgi:hypothetical protein